MIKQSKRKFKKLFGTALGMSLLFSAINVPTDVYATEFEGNEQKYITLCSSKSLTSANQSKCKEFNIYLKDKNQKIQKSIEESKNNKETLKNDIAALKNKILEIDKEITDANNDISYIETNIANKESDIKEKEQLLKDRLYAMQSTLNSNMYIEYLFGAESFSDFLARTSQLQEITEYDEGLIDDLTNEMKELKSQKELLNSYKSTLDAKKKEQESLQNTYLSKLASENANIADMSHQHSSNSESMEVINQNLADMQKAADASNVGHVSQATNNNIPKKDTSSNSQQNNNQNNSSNSSSNNTSNSNNSSNSNNNTNSNNNINNSNSNSSNNTNNGNSSNSNSNNNSSSSDLSSAELGLKIANKALSKQGLMYVWGGAHSMSEIRNPNQTKFDCSGLVSWAHYQAGVNIGVQYTGSLVYMGKQVSRSNLQAGDIILFSNNGSTSGVHHVGIYIGNNQMVHAPCTGKAIQVANLSSSYWQQQWLVARRLY